MNRIVGDKVAIVSDKPQTTRRAIRGVATGDDWQLVLVDLPGVQRPRDPLTERMQRQVERELADSDAALFVLNGEQEIGPGDRFIAEAIKRAGVPAVTVLNKVDRLDRAAHRGGAGRRRGARRAGRDLPGEREDRRRAWRTLVERARSRCCRRGRSSTRRRSRPTSRSSVRLAELIREQVLLRTREELPHAVEVEVDEIEEREDGLLVVRARVWAETESQKGILVGAGGRMVRAVGTAARKEIEALLGRRVHLDLQRARAQGLAPRRGPARPAGHRVIERIHRFFRHAEEGVVRRGRDDRARHGAAHAEPAARVAAERDPRGGPGREPEAARRRGRRGAGAPSATASWSCTTSRSAPGWRPRSSARAGTSSAC